MLYEGNYSLDLYKSFRKLYEEISTASNSLYQFDSDDETFLKEKDELITQNLQICEEIQSNTIAHNVHLLGSRKKNRKATMRRVTRP